MRFIDASANEYSGEIRSERHEMDPEVGTVILEFSISSWTSKDLKAMAQEDVSVAAAKAKMNDDWMNWSIQL